MEFSAVNRRRPSRETPPGPGAKKDGCFRRLDFGETTESNSNKSIEQFRYIKMQPKTIDLSMTPRPGNKPHNKLCIVIPRSLVLRSIDLG